MPEVNTHRIAGVILDAIAVMLLLFIVVAGGITYLNLDEISTPSQENLELTKQNSANIQKILDTLESGGCVVSTP